jgi:hypothetical protein
MLGLTAVLFVTALLPLPSVPGIRISRTLLMGVLTATGAVLAYITAKRFAGSDKGRWVWLLIGFAGTVDCLMFVLFLLPRLLGMREMMNTLAVVVTALIVLSRIAVAIALFMMVQLYRKTGLGFGIERRDYAVMAFLTVAGIVAVALSSSIARSQVSDSGLARDIQLIGFPLIPALALSSVLGVVVWRYAKQMGGGLVAKAWYSILLYTALWLMRLVLLGLLTYLLDFTGANRPAIASIASLIVLLAAEYTLFLGASYQYEACTGFMRLATPKVQAAAAHGD